ncbi:sigma-70 family RNA polymerase sigma factor [Hyphomicrobium sp. D-2]|uniref:sigma-70 family RNA polymerase sigma factor n=1 Tax=Hyphomicrobium sp. D-2 TaxID=3041621 RepID=UPI002456D332|nr:sigma-70 family RNA polymerase sigma factor [Hyphomicrobium sp. D-2]MDH4982418.1 sigma-70 family RNA polymerase sigma factor [Hyphomicrobium sp. D-2]
MIHGGAPTKARRARHLRAKRISRANRAINIMVAVPFSIHARDAHCCEVQHNNVRQTQSAIAAPSIANDNVRVDSRIKGFDYYSGFRRELVDYATMFVRDRARGEDVVQEAFLRLETSIAEDRPIKEPLSYLRRIVRNLCLDWLRRFSIERAYFDSEYPPETIVEDRPNPEEAFCSQQELRLVMKAISELPERTRIAFELHRFEGWKLKDIAARLDISVALTHSLIFDGLKDCRRRLAIEA